MKKLYPQYGKRIMDIVLAGVAVIFLSPVFLIIMYAIYLKLDQPIFFKQKRAGLNGDSFTLYKFRTMTNEKDGEGNLLSDSQRLTPIGMFLRSTSLDELPSLYNILKGEMSLVGPRPLDINYLPYYTATEQVRHAVRPGLTGLAQVKGRNSLVWEERFKHDLYYVQKLSLILDLKIIFETFSIVLKRSDIGIRGEGVLIDFDVYRSKTHERFL